MHARPRASSGVPDRLPATLRDVLSDQARTTPSVVIQAWCARRTETGPWEEDTWRAPGSRPRPARPINALPALCARPRGRAHVTPRRAPPRRSVILLRRSGSARPETPDAARPARGSPRVPCRSRATAQISSFGQEASRSGRMPMRGGERDGPAKRHDLEPVPRARTAVPRARTAVPRARTDGARRTAVARARTVVPRARTDRASVLPDGASRGRPPPK